jgi:hypothetical protein
VIAKAFVLAKDNYRIGAKILRENKLIRDHGAFPDAIGKQEPPMMPKRRKVPVGDRASRSLRPGDSHSPVAAKSKGPFGRMILNLTLA